MDDYDTRYKDGYSSYDPSYEVDHPKYHEENYPMNQDQFTNTVNEAIMLLTNYSAEDRFHIHAARLNFDPCFVELGLLVDGPNHVGESHRLHSILVYLHLYPISKGNARIQIWFTGCPRIVDSLFTNATEITDTIRTLINATL